MSKLPNIVKQHDAIPATRRYRTNRPMREPPPASVAVFPRPL